MGVELKQRRATVGRERRGCGRPRMRRLQCPRLRLLSSNSPLTPLSFCFSTSSSPPGASLDSKPTLTQQEIDKINLLIPRLCLSNHFPTAIQLIDAAFLLNPPLKSLSLAVLLHSLTLQPDMTHPMSLLTRLHHNPNARHYLTPVATLLLDCYFKKRKAKEALKVFNWTMRPHCITKLNEASFRILIAGFCRNGMILEGLKAMRAMVDSNLIPGRDVRTRTFRALLREARIEEAVELKEALAMAEDDDGGGEHGKKILALLDQMICHWDE